MPARRYGNQRPSFTNAPDELLTVDNAAVRMFESYGVEFYESQKLEMGLFIARDESGDYAAKSIYISKPRQNGKSYAAQFYAIWCAAVLGMNVLFTAHRVKTVRKMFKAIKTFVENTPDFKRALMPHGIYSAFGYESVEFADKHGKLFGSIEFQTRSDAGGLGLTYDVIIVDEAQLMTEGQQEALLPTSIASSEVTRKLSQQTIYLGTPPKEKDIGTVFRDAHDKAHSGIMFGAWWLEWAVDDPVDVTDKKAVIDAAYKTNPAMGYRIRESGMLERASAMTPEGFAREHLGWWCSYRVGEIVIDEELWAATAVDKPAAPGVRAFAVKFELGGTYAALAVAVRPADGPCRVELVNLYDTTHGLEALKADVVRAAKTASEIVIDGGGYAQTLIQRLVAAGVSEKVLHRPTPIEITTASTNLVTCLKEGTVQHYASSGQKLLDDSATKSVRRSVGRAGGFSWQSTEDAYAEPIEAAALALLYALKTKRDPSRKAVLL